MTASTAEQFDRLPPSAIDAEMCAIGSLMLAGSDSALFAEIAAVISPRDCYQPDVGIVLGIALELHRAGKPVDAVLVRAELEKRGQLVEIGGTEFLARILNSVPSSAHGVHYAKLVREAAAKREIIQAAHTAVRRAYEPRTEETAEAIGQRLMEQVARSISVGRSLDYSSAGDVLALAYEQLERGTAPLVATQFRDIDSAIAGIALGETMVIGARPSMGKSTIARQMAMRVSGSVPVAFISLEESREKIGRNWFSAFASIDNNRLRRGDNLLREEWEALATGIARMSSRPLYVVTRCFKLPEIRSMASLLVAKHGVKLVVIDYLQKIQVEGKDRFEKVTNASQELSTLWKELGVAGLVLAQLKREVTQRDDKRPTMSDLRESGQIEQDADIIAFLHREDYYHITDPNYLPTQQAEFIIAKMRDGERGRNITLKSELNFQRFADAEQRQDLAGAFD
jgi:replicative DNA helicase